MKSRPARHVEFASGVILASLVLAVSAGPAAADHDLFRRITTGQINGNGEIGAFHVGNSLDGTRVFFVSNEQLVSADTDTEQDVYERFNGVTRLVSIGTVNGNSPLAASFVDASDDGTRVLFETAEALLPADTDAHQDVYERSGGITRLISTGPVNGNLPINAGWAASNPDGTRVLFTTSEALTSDDTDTNGDVYERNGSTTIRVSVGAINGNGDFFAGFVGASRDLSRIFFTTREKLVSGDTDSQSDIYRRYAGTTTRISAGPTGGNGPLEPDFHGASADGRVVIFSTEERLVVADTDDFYDVYRRVGSETKLVSKGTINGNGPEDASFGGVSADGARVFFTTNEALLPADTDTAQDVYERKGKITRLLSVGQINGNAETPARFSRATSDGTRVFFSTDEQLVAADDDTADDVYERSGDTTTLISVSEVNGPEPVVLAFISADGTRLFFSSFDKLVSADTDNRLDIYQRSAGVTTLVTLGSAEEHVHFAGASADGRRVFYFTDERVLSNDVDNTTDVYAAIDSP